MPKKKVVIISVIAILILCLLACIAVFSYGREYEPASSVSELLLGVEYSGNTAEIRIWENEDGEYYFFIPTGSADQSLKFLNLPKSGIKLDGETIKPGMDISLRRDLFSEKHSISFENGTSEEVSFLCSANIGAMFINTESGSTDSIHADKNVKEPASALVVGFDGKTKYNGDLDYIKCRGVSSFLHCDKKSYTIKFAKKVSFFGEGKNEKLVLIANHYDDSKIKNKLAYDYVRDNSVVLAPDSEFVDLYINGEYLGNYLVCQNIEEIVGMSGADDLKAENKAVNSKGSLSLAIPSSEGEIRGYSGLNSPSDITGGYIIEIEDPIDVPCSFTTESGVFCEVVYPDNATIEEVRYIRDYMNEAERAFTSEDGVNPDTGKHYSEYIDIESWAETFVIDELFSDPDKTVSNRSIFLYKFSDNTDKHIFAGPVWDFDLALGEETWVNDNIYLDYPNSTTGEGLVYSEYLLNRADINEKMESYFTETAAVYVDDYAHAKIRSVSDTIKASLALESIRWPGAKGRYASEEANWEYIYWFLTNRKDFLDEVWIQNVEYHEVVFLDSSGNICESYKIKHGEPITRIPHVVSYEGVFAGWRFGDRDWLLVEGMPILEDVTFYSEWLNADLFSKNIETISGVDLSEVDLDALKALVTAVEEAQKDGESK